MPQKSTFNGQSSNRQEKGGQGGHFAQKGGKEEEILKKEEKGGTLHPGLGISGQCTPPPRLVDRQTPVKTLPSRCTIRTRAVINVLMTGNQ